MDLREAHDASMSDPEYRREWERLEPQFQVSRAFVRLRAQRGWTQAEFAQRLGVSQSYVAKLEAGRNITLRQLWRVARALDCTLELLFRERDEEMVPGVAVRLQSFPVQICLGFPARVRLSFPVREEVA